MYSDFGFINMFPCFFVILNISKIGIYIFLHRGVVDMLDQTVHYPRNFNPK